MTVNGRSFLGLSRGPRTAVRRVMATLEVRGRAQGELLHRLVERGLPVFRDRLEATGRDLPPWVWRELQCFQQCGDPANGFAWLVCDPCQHHRLVPFTCGGRGFCPTCGGRRMATLAAHWSDLVLPDVALRQWVFTVPWDRRWLLARRPDLARKVLALALDRVRRFLVQRARERGLRGGRTGSVTVVQRFGSALNLNVHFHALVLDGVYVRETDGLRFHRDLPPANDDVERLVEDVADARKRCSPERASAGTRPSRTSIPTMPSLSSRPPVSLGTPPREDEEPVACRPSAGGPIGCRLAARPAMATPSMPARRWDRRTEKDASASVATSHARPSHARASPSSRMGSFVSSWAWSCPGCDDSPGCVR